MKGRETQAELTARLWVEERKRLAQNVAKMLERPSNTEEPDHETVVRKFHERTLDHQQEADLWQQMAAQFEQGQLLDENGDPVKTMDSIPRLVSRQVFPARWEMYDRVSGGDAEKRRWANRLAKTEPPVPEAGAGDVPPVAPPELAPPVTGGAPVPNMAGGVPTTPPAMDGANAMEMPL